VNLPKLTSSEVFKWAAGIGSILVLIYAMLWGVPGYLESQVRVLYAAEVSVAGPSQEEKNLIAQMQAVEHRLERVEDTVNDFSIRFIAYLERQAERNQ